MRWGKLLVVGYVLASLCACNLSSDCGGGCGTDQTTQEYSCDLLDEEQCADREDCAPILGKELFWDTETGCYTLGEEAFQSCTSSDQQCPNGIHIRSDSSDTCYEFRGCVPEGLSRCSGTAAGECP